MICLTSSQLTARIDPDRGADIVDLTHRPSGASLFFSTPWRNRADRGVQVMTGSQARWLEGYRGGWQTLIPNAGQPKSVGGAEYGFHGEASVVPWVAVDADESLARLEVELTSVPVRIERHVSLNDGSLRIDDRLENLSTVELELDYVHHPAFGGDFLSGSCTIESGARVFINDTEGGWAGAPFGSRHRWPRVDGHTETLDLRRVPASDEPRALFGWLTDFEQPWASISNGRLSARLDWDGQVMPHAWLWQELGGSTGWPWFGRARTVAIEPSSTPTSGPDRQSAVSLGPRGALETWVQLSISRL